MDECDLRRRVMGVGFECDGDECVFWTRLGMSGEPQCAIKFFRLLEGSGPELADWLLSLKDEQVAHLLGQADDTPTT